MSLRRLACTLLPVWLAAVGCANAAPVAPVVVIQSAASPRAVGGASAAEQLDGQARALLDGGELEQAASTAERALAIRLDDPSTSPRLLAKSLLLLATIRDRRAEYSAAKLLAQRAQAALARWGSADADLLAEAQEIIAQEALGRRSYAEARALFEEAVAVRERGGASVALANVLAQVASTHLGEREYATAEGILRRALAMVEATGSGSRSHAAIVLALAEAYRYQRKYAEAEPRYLEAIRLEQAGLNAGDILFATTYNNLAVMYHYGMHELTKAEPYYRKALATYLSKVSPKSVRIAQVRMNLGLLLCEMGDWRTGEPIFEEGLQRFETIVGPQHAEVYNHRAYLERLRAQKPP